MKLRVVVCDDTPAVRKLVRVVLAEHGIEVVGEAGNGADAVEAVRTFVPDVILLDLAMPVMDGLEAIPLIKVAAPTTKIVVMTAFDGTMVEAALQAGADAYLAKENAMRDLPATLLSVVDPQLRS